MPILNGAIVIFVVIAVLFVICLAIFIKSYLGYREENMEIEEEEYASRKKRVKEPPAPVLSKPEPPAEPVKTEPVKPEEEALPEPEAEDKSDGFETRVSTPEEMALIREAGKAISQQPIRRPPVPEPVTRVHAPEPEPKKSKLIPIVTATAAVIAVVCVAVLIFVIINANRPVEDEDRKTNVATVAVTTEYIQLHETVTGKITSPDTITSNFAVNGRIEVVNVSEGDTVSQGDVIYVIDSSNLQARIDLLSDKLASVTEKITPQTVSVTATSSGTVSKMAVSKGDNVNAGDVIAEIYNSADHTVTVTLTNRVSVGDRVTVSSGGSSVQGTVTSVKEISTASENDDDEDSDDEEEPDTAWSATVTFSTTYEVGSNATVTVNGEKASGSVNKGRSSTVSVTAGTKGKISELKIKTGDSVSGGDVLAVIEEPLPANAAEFSFEARELQIEIDQLTTELDNYTIKAQTDGYIQKLYHKKGENAVLNMSAVTIIPKDGLSLAIELDAEVKENMTLPAAVSFKMQRSSDFPADVWNKLDTNRTFHATIDNNSLSLSESGDKYVGYVALEDQSLFRIGMTAKVSVTTYYADNAIVIPKELVKNGKVKILNSSGKVETVDVETGVLTSDGGIEIKSGLSKTDRIVTE